MKIKESIFVIVITAIKAYIMLLMYNHILLSKGGKKEKEFIRILEFKTKIII